MPRMARSLTAMALAILFGLGLWFRVTSLESMPFPDGDEAFFGIQAQQMLAGEPVAWKTTTNLAISPFNMGPLVALHAVVGPGFWLLRLPSLVSGILAVVLTYGLGARVLDRTTALIAAGAMAVLPIAIIFSRLGYDSSQAPLVGVLALYFAFRGGTVGLGLATLACFWSHPTNVFVAPVLSAVALARGFGGPSANPARRRWGAVATAAVPLGAALVFGVYMTFKNQAQGTYPNAFGNHDWTRFCVLYDRFLMGLGLFPTPEGTLRRYDLSLWAVALGVSVLGTIRLAKARHWDRLALVVGLAASLVGFHLVAGTDGFQIRCFPALRYGLFLVAPTCLAVGCLARSLLVEPTNGRWMVLRQVQHLALLAGGFACLLTVKVNWFDQYACTGESALTFRHDSVDPFRLTTAALLGDIERTRPGPLTGVPRAVVMTSNYWVDQPMRYLGRRGREIAYLPYGQLMFLKPPPPPSERIRRIRSRMEAGAYAVCDGGSELETLVTTLYQADRLWSWKGCYSIYRLKTAAELAQARAGARGPVVR